MVLSITGIGFNLDNSWTEGFSVNNIYSKLLYTQYVFQFIFTQPSAQERQCSRIHGRVSYHRVRSVWTNCAAWQRCGSSGNLEDMKGISPTLQKIIPSPGPLDNVWLWSITTFNAVHFDNLDMSWKILVCSIIIFICFLPPWSLGICNSQHESYDGQHLLLSCHRTRVQIHSV